MTGVQTCALPIFLEELGYAVDVASNGSEAVERACSGSYAFVLMDYHLPIMDGLTAAREIRKVLDRHALPIIAMTASAFEEDFRLCIEAGMDEHIGKPVDVAQLHAALARGSS